jgi:putative transposase
MRNYEKTKFTETQFVKAITEHKKGRRAEDLCGELSISTVTFYKWRQKYGGFQVNELKKMKAGHFYL